VWHSSHPSSSLFTPFLQHAFLLDQDARIAKNCLCLFPLVQSSNDPSLWIVLHAVSGKVLLLFGMFVSFVIAVFMRGLL